MPPIGELTRIEQVHLDRLERQGIFTTGLLLEVSETLTRRQTLADQVAATTNDVLTWRDEALMLNLASFGPDDHQLLMQGRIDGLHDILGLDLAIGGSLADGRLRPYGGAGYNRLQPRFQVNFTNRFGETDHRRVTVDLDRLVVFGGATWQLTERLGLSGELYAAPSDAVTGRLIVRTAVGP